MFTHIATEYCKEKETLCMSVKLKLNFPAYPNMFIIFHGRTVHSGAESKIFSLSSAQTSHDTRLFSYITSKEYDNESKQNIRIRNKGKEQSGQVDRDGISVCSEQKNQCKACTESMHEDVVEIDLLAEYNSIKKTKRAQLILHYVFWVTLMSMALKSGVV